MTSVLALAQRRLSRYLAVQMRHLPEQVQLARGELLAVQLYQALTLWDSKRRQGDANYSDENLAWLMENLIDVVSAGLTAPVSGPCARQMENSKQ